jgi:hypothetical protein
MGKFRLTRLTTARTWGKPPPLIVYFVLGHRTNTQMTFCLGTPTWEFEIPKVGTPTTLGVHNFVYRPLIEMRFEAKL